MKWYFASRMRHQDTIQEIVEFLKVKGHKIAYEWQASGSLKPYHQNAERAKNIAERISEAVKQTDVFVLITDKAGTDMFIELGIAISTALDNKTTRIYAVGKHNDRSLMHFHPKIQQADSLNEVMYKELESINEKDKDTLNMFDKKLNE